MPTLLLRHFSHNIVSFPQGILYFSNELRLRCFHFDRPEKDQEDLKTGQFSELFPHLPKGPFYQQPTWLYRFSRLAFVSKMITGKAVLFLGNPKSGEVESISQFDRWIDPSFSPDERWFAYFSILNNTQERHQNPLKSLPPHQLIIQGVDSGEKIILADDAAPPGPRPLWLSNSDILYINFEHQLAQISIKSKEKNIWGAYHVDPLALSSDGTQIICINDAYPATTIYLLNVSKRTIKPIKKYTSIGRTILWAPDGQSFLFNRAEFFDKWIYWDGKALRLYWHDLKTGKEKKIARRLWLESGIWLLNDPFQNKSKDLQD